MPSILVQNALPLQQIFLSRGNRVSFWLSQYLRHVMAVRDSPAIC